jgi:predicted ATPase/DNA-binding winged helix-turn-helix (wHTH) protein
MRSSNNATPFRIPEGISQEATAGGDSAGASDALTFGRFRLLPVQRILLEEGRPVRLGARAFDILVALARRPGELVSKETLMAEVWPATFVEGANLRVNIAALRKALGDTDARLIRTDSGRGYRFTTGVDTVAKPASAPIPSTVWPRKLPNPTTRLIGRSEFVAQVVGQLPARRLITLTGPGGIGKTRVAIACAQEMAGSYRDGIAFVDLSTARDQQSVTAALADALDVADYDNCIHAVVRRLLGRQMLLVLDNCEHVIQVAAELAEMIITRSPGVHVLATSRESLRVFGELVRVLPPLPSPPAGVPLTAAEALTYPTVELFVERVCAAHENFQLSDSDAPLVGEICRRLDGVALAIELAAAQVDVLGIAWLAAHMDDRLWILNRGPRTAAPRHQTLGSLLDWSYTLLSEQERATLQSVARFPGDFSLADAVTMAANNGVDEVQAVAGLSGLVSKSLALLDVSGAAARYRLPETTRVYVCAKATHASRATALVA